MITAGIFGKRLITVRAVSNILMYDRNDLLNMGCEAFILGAMNFKAQLAYFCVTVGTDEVSIVERGEDTVA